jgi:hypothetical protein
MLPLVLFQPEMLLRHVRLGLHAEIMEVAPHPQSLYFALQMAHILARRNGLRLEKPHCAAEYCARVSSRLTAAFAEEMAALARSRPIAVGLAD